MSVLFWAPLAVLLLVQPLVPESWPLWGAHVATIAALLAFAAPGVWRAGRVRWGVPALAIGLALVSLGVALLAQPNDAPRVESRWMALTGALDAAFFLIAWWWLPGPGADDADRRRTAIVLGALLLAICGEQLVLGLLRRDPGDPDTRLGGTLGNPNVLGAVFAATALFVLSAGFTLRRAALARGEPARRAMAPLSVAVLLAAPLAWALLLTRSRGAMAALLVTLLLLAVRWRRWRLIVAVIGVVLLLIAVPNPLRERLFALRSEHAFSRGFVWAAGLKVASSHPLGMAPASFKDAFLPLALDPEHPWLLHQRAEVGLTHNVFITLAVEWGWLAVASLLALLVWSTRRLWVSRGGRDHPLRLGATLGALVLLFELQVDGLEQNPLVFSIFLLLAAVSLCGLPRPAGIDVPARAVAGVLLVAGLASGGLVAWRMHGQHLMHGAAALSAAWTPGADPAPVRAAIDAATAALPGELDGPRERALFETRVLHVLFDAASGKPAASRGDDPLVRQAVEAGQRAAAAAVAAAGTDPDAHRLGADLELLLWRRIRHHALLLEFVQRAQAVLALDPLDVEGHFELAQEAQHGGLEALAQQEYATVFRLEPDHVVAWALLARQKEASGDKAGALYDWVRASEAILNCRIKAQVDTPRSHEFFEDLLRKVDQNEVLEHIYALRQALFS